MSLREYHRKRDFGKTAEPKGKAKSLNTAQGISDPVQITIRRFQKHAASHLHYDFRLELDGVLKSWAVPKGPSLDPSVRSLAMQVEDHPLEYGRFEGTIPQGEYGGGTVMVWDEGTWEPEADAAQEYAAGRMHFTLHGKRLHGSWALAQTRVEKGRAQWLLIKRRDAAAIPDDERDLVERYARSVITDRSMEEIAADSDRSWTVAGEQKLRRRKHAAKRKSARTKSSPTKKAAASKSVSKTTRKQGRSK